MDVGSCLIEHCQIAFWPTFFLWLATTVLSDYFRPSLPRQTPAGLGSFNIPTATEGRYIPIMSGTMQMKGPNCVWYGDYVTEPRTTTTGLIFKRDEIIGFTYYLAMQYAQVHVEVAGITGAWIGDEKVYEGPAVDVVDIDRPDLFGDVDSGGGFVGRIRLFKGTQDQAVSSYLASRLSPLPAYRGTAYIMITNIAETGGANIGESNSVREIRCELQAFDDIAGTAGSPGLGDALGLGNDHHFIGADINPIVWAYDVYTNTDWGGGFAPSEFNLDNFKENAETIYNEGIGFARIYDTLQKSEDVISEIEQHIDGYIGPNPVTGKIEVKLARNDYTLANEFQADASNILDITKWSQSDWSQTKNELFLQYEDRAKSYKETYAKAQSLANRVIQSRAASDNISMPGVHEASVANKIVWRMARSRFRPQTSGTIEFDTSAFGLLPGAVLSVTDEENNITDLACRVIRVAKGNMDDPGISVDVVSDIFGNETVGSADPPASGFVPPVQSVAALAVEDQAAVEAPFGVTQFDAESSNTKPRILTLARATSGYPTEYDVVRRTRTPPTGFTGLYTSSEVIRGSMMFVGTLRNAESGWQPGNGTITMEVDPITGSLDALIGTYSPNSQNAAGIAVISPGTSTEEWVVCRAIADSGSGIELQQLYRSAFDTAMHPHASGARIWFVWTGGFGLPLEVFTPGDGVDLKFLPASPSDSVDVGDATALSEVSLADPPRYGLPLLPYDVEFNGASFPSGNVDFDTAATGGPGLDLTAYFRLWRVTDPLWSVQGLDIDGAALEAADLAGENIEVSAWLYDLDSTPSPTRGIDEIDSVIDQAVSNPSEVVTFLRADLITAGITVDFAARLELEVKHSPTGEEADQVTREPLFFDFSAIGTW